jgi:hypothetical protein
MKVWLDDLKPGDIFWKPMFNHAVKCEVIGNAHNLNFKMPKFKIKVLWARDLENLKPYEIEDFVNHYVYTTEEEAINELIDKLNSKKETLMNDKILLEVKEHELNTAIERYGKEFYKKYPKE